MRLTALLALCLSLASVAVAQTVLVYGDNALPTCAQSCTLLQQAQSACVPPAAPVTDQATYQSCFCQSGYLTTLKTSAAGVCDTACGSSDQQQVQTWYLSTCQLGTTDAAATVTPAGASTSAATVAGTSTTAPATASATAATSGSVAGSQQRNPSWWDRHWKWVVMVIVLFVAFVAIAVAGVLIRRHFDRKRDRINSTFNSGITHRSAPMMATSGPPLSHQFDGPPQPGYATDAHGSAMYLPSVRERDRKAMQ